MPDKVVLYFVAKPLGVHRAGRVITSADLETEDAKQAEQLIKDGVLLKLDGSEATSKAMREHVEKETRAAEAAREAEEKALADAAKAQVRAEAKEARAESAAQPAGRRSAEGQGTG